MPATRAVGDIGDQQAVIVIHTDKERLPINMPSAAATFGYRPRA